MALIPKEYVPPKKEQRNVRLDPDTSRLLERYCEFVESSPNYVVESLLRYTFRRDRDFQVWLETHPARAVAAGGRVRESDSKPERG